MSEQKKEELLEVPEEPETPDPKARLKIFKARSGEDIIINPEISIYERAIMDHAEHPEQAKEYGNIVLNMIADLMPLEKMMKKSGFDLEKELELNEERRKEISELLEKQIKAEEELAKEISDLNNNMEIIKIFNKNLQEMKKVPKKVKKEKKEKRDPFEVIVPKNFWESILEDEDILSDE